MILPPPGSFPISYACTAVIPTSFEQSLTHVMLRCNRSVSTPVMQVSPPSQSVTPITMRSSVALPFDAAHFTMSSKESLMAWLTVTPPWCMTIFLGGWQ
jgi:hypothetical protein